MASFGGLTSAVWAALGFDSPNNPDRGQQFRGPMSRATDSGLAVGDQSALQVSAVWACARIITNVVGSLPISVYDRTKDGREANEDHFLYPLLKLSPNRFMSPLEFRRAMTLQQVLWGNGFALVERNPSGKPVAWRPLNPDSMAVVRSESGVTYHYNNGEGIHVYSPESIFHLKSFSSDGLVGMAPLDHMRQVLGVSVSANRFAAKAFSSNGRPPGFLKYDKWMNEEQREAARKIYEGVSVDDTKLWLLEGGVDYKSVNIPPDHLQMLESRNFQVSEICRFFGVPSYLVNDTEKSTSWGTGIEQQNLGFLQYTVDAYLKSWESAISHQMLKPNERRSVFVEHNVDGLLRADSKSRAEFFSKMAQNGIMTRNEIRAKQNLPPMDGGNELTVQVNLTPVDELPKVNSNAE